ncbi:hypothetical protein H0H87_006422 [Tephrocybe sp. NHM501043]|nr:hypothetical protein H0H87_006422 [Tephrocybe sp. NHM501043]
MFLARRGGLRSLRRAHCIFPTPILSRAFAGQTNPPLNLDPTLQAALQEGDMSLLKGNMGKHVKELEVVSVEEQFASEEDNEDEPYAYGLERKSPAAHYGSRQIGAVILPNQLQNAINGLISHSDKIQLHSDAKRLFFDEGGPGSESEWEARYSTSDYRSRKQAYRHAERDGTAFASVVLPAHYSAILSVLDHFKRRLEPSYRVERVIDWGAGTGSGLWAALHAFQSPESKTPAGVETKIAANSSLVSYVGIDKREGLVTIGKRLLEGIDLGSLALSWQKTFKEDDRISGSDGHNTIAMSAFTLSTLPTSQHRKSLVKEMWESGAHVMVLIDHNTPAGFEAIAQSREYLLNLGRKESKDVETKKSEDVEAKESEYAEVEKGSIRGSHVVAPCPHDGACPLLHPGSTRLVCGFSQRIQRPSFVRKTKHSGVGHEDIEYSYVVIRRGSRPISTTENVGRVGEVGRRVLEKEAFSQGLIKELKLHSERVASAEYATEDTPVVATDKLVTETELSPVELEEALRLESYSWPRLVFTPMKKSGHIILDSCTPEGKIMRLTIPKSQGKQEFYDARKAAWGDLFPHSPKNTPLERYQPTRAKRKGGMTPMSGSDIGKRKQDKKDVVSYDALSKELKEGRKRSHRDRPYHFS